MTSASAFRVIYIDDEPDLCEVFKDNFLSDQIRIETFTDPNQGLEAVQKHPPDLLFLDYRLPNTTGDLIAQKLDASIPKVLITGDLTAQPVAQFIRIFSKPFDFTEMKAFLTDRLRSLAKK